VTSRGADAPAPASAESAAGGRTGRPAEHHAPSVVDVSTVEDAVELGGELVTESGERTVVGVNGVDAIRQELAILSEEDEQESVQEREALLSAKLDVPLWRQAVRCMRQEPLDAETGGVEDTLLQPHPDAQPTLVAAGSGTDDQGGTVGLLPEGDRREELVQPQEVIELRHLVWVC
jgi:hypothetical protein